MPYARYNRKAVSKKVFTNEDLFFLLFPPFVRTTNRNINKAFLPKKRFFVQSPHRVDFCAAKNYNASIIVNARKKISACVGADYAI